MPLEMTNVHEHIAKEAKRLAPKVQSIREHIHQYPELSFQEHETMRFVAEQLQALHIPFETAIAGTGIIAWIRPEGTTAETPHIGLRSELDALPIQENTEAPYASTHPGIMHACGHDVHTSILLGAAEVLNGMKNNLPQPVALFFQPGEEKNPGGASLMIADGALKKMNIERMIALHVFPEMEVGKLGFREGLYMASCDEIHLTIHGKGGHGATPHQTIDPIWTGVQIINQLQAVVSRFCDPKIPSVLSFGHFEALGATNVIPEKAHLKGTFRTMNEAWRTTALEKISQTINAVCSSTGATAELEISKGYPFLENDPLQTQRMRTICQNHFGNENIEELPIRLTSEDFSFFAQAVPVCFFRLGVRNEANGITYGVHHPKFDIDPQALEIGIRAMALAPFS